MDFRYELFALPLLSSSHYYSSPEKNAAETHGVQSSRSFIEHLMGKLKNFKYLEGLQHTQIRSFELALDAAIALHNASARLDALERLKAAPRRKGEHRRHLKPKPTKALRVGKTTPQKKRPLHFNKFHKWLTSREYLSDGAAANAAFLASAEDVEARLTRNQSESMKLRPKAVERARNAHDAGHFSWLEVTEMADNTGYIVCGHVGASFMDDRYKVYVGLTEAGIEWKFCSGPQGKNACSHYGCLLEVLQRLREDSVGRNVQVKKRRPATPLEKLKKRPLLEVIDEKMVSRLAARIPVAFEPLHKPYERLFCVCRKPRDVNDMLGCENCDEWYHRRCVGVHGAMTEREIDSWTCGFCEAEELAEEDEDEFSWLIEKQGRSNGKAKTFTRARGDTPKRKIEEGILMSGNRGPSTKNECIADAKAEAARIHKKSKNYRESADGMALRHQREGTGHHTIDRAVAGGGGTTRAPMTADMIQQLVEDN